MPPKIKRQEAELSETDLISNWVIFNLLKSNFFFFRRSLISFNIHKSSKNS